MYLTRVILSQFYAHWRTHNLNANMRRMTITDYAGVAPRINRNLEQARVYESNLQHSHVQSARHFRIDNCAAAATRASPPI